MLFYKKLTLFAMLLLSSISYINATHIMGSDITYELSQTEFTITDAGTHIVVMTVTDASGNSNQVWTTDILCLDIGRLALSCGCH